MPGDTKVGITRCRFAIMGISWPGASWVVLRWRSGAVEAASAPSPGGLARQGRLRQGHSAQVAADIQGRPRPRSAALPSPRARKVSRCDLPQAHEAHST